MAKGNKEIENFDLTVSIPLDKVNVGNLTNLLDAKGDLIMKALGIDDLPIEITEDEISFPWFKDLTDLEASTAYTNFIAAICRMSLEQNRVASTAKPVENEKYAFRCFLLRLGYIGPEYKAERKILLQNLSGSAAFKGNAQFLLEFFVYFMASILLDLYCLQSDIYTNKKPREVKP